MHRRRTRAFESNGRGRVGDGTRDSKVDDVWPILIIRRAYGLLFWSHENVLGHTPAG